jgi:hypothetical protein
MIETKGIRIEKIDLDLKTLIVAHKIEQKERKKRRRHCHYKVGRSCRVESNNKSEGCEGAEQSNVCSF